MIKLKEMPKRLSYIVGAQWTRDVAWTIFTILLARHSPEFLGQIMLALSYGYIIRMIADAGLNNFLLSIFARKEGRPTVILGEITWIKIILLVIAIISAWIITGLLDYNIELRITIIAISLGLGLDAITNSFFALCQARGRQDVEMKIRVPASLLGIGYGILLVSLNASPLYIGLYKLIESLIIIIFVLKALGRNPLKAISFTRLKNIIIQWKHGIIFTGMSFCAMLYNKINIFFLKKYSDDASVGAYSVAWETIEGLSVLVSSALLAKVIFPVMATYWKDNKSAFYSLAGKTCRSLWAISLPLMYVLYVESDRILPLIYGQNYVAAVEVQKILVPCLATAFLHNLAAYAMIGMKYQRLLLLFYASGLCLNIILCSWLIPLNPLEGAAYALTATKIWVAILTVSFFQYKVKPMSMRQWLLMLLVIAVSAGLWIGLKDYFTREIVEIIGLIPLLWLLWIWRPATPWENKSIT